MRTWWSPLSRRLAIVRVALAVPLLMRLPLPRLEAFLEWTAARRPPPAGGDPDAVAATVLEMLQAGRPLVRPGCLTRGLTLYYFLRRAGVDVGLTFGMGRVEGRDGFEGHCWLVRAGEPYLESRDPNREYATMYSFRRESAAYDPPK
jgi:hypothetical protein